MIQALIITLSLALIGSLILSISFPNIANEIITIGDTIVYYIDMGMGIVWLFVPKTITLAIGGAAIAIEVIILGYNFVMWILRKIPTASIH